MSAARRRSKRRANRPTGQQQGGRLSTVKPVPPREIEWLDERGLELYESHDAWKRRFPSNPGKSAHDRFTDLIDSLRNESEQGISRLNQFERLSRERKGLSSVRYNRRERIVFYIRKDPDASEGEAEVLEIHEAGGHYDD